MSKYYGGIGNGKTIEVLNKLYEFIATDKFEKIIIALSNKRLKIIYSEKYVFKLENRINNAINLIDKNIMIDENILKNAKKLGLDENRIKQISTDLNLYKFLKTELKGEE